MARTDVYKYATNASTTGVSVVCGIKLTDVVKAAAGAEPGGALPSGYFLVDLTRNKRSAGLSPRGLILSKVSGPGPKTAFIPILTNAEWAAINATVTRSFQGGTYKVTKRDEKGYE